MSPSELQLEVVRTLQRFAPLEKLDKLIREHTAENGRCWVCHTVGPCTLFTAAMSARHVGTRAR